MCTQNFLYFLAVSISSSYFRYEICILQISLDEDDRDDSRFLFLENSFEESNLPQICRFITVLFGVNYSPFLLATTVKHYLHKYIKKYPKMITFVNENIYVDNVIGCRCSVE